MFLSFIEGFLLGLGAAVPLGPINILLMNRALLHYPHAVVTGLGAMSADGLYLFLILFGMAAIFQGSAVLDFMALFGSLFLVFLAYRIFQGRKQHISPQNSDKNRQKLHLAYFQGFVLTFVNPYTVAFWLSVATYVSSRNLDPLFTLAGMFSAILIWVTLMPYLVHRSRHRISPRVSYLLNLFSSLLLAGFGLVLLFELW